MTIRFGTDGWRGVIADDFTFPNVRRVAGATADFILKQRDTSQKPVLVGFDRRFFSPEFARCVADVFKARGLDVRLSRSAMTTPSMSVEVTRQKAGWGIILTASHNPALYNGFKVKDRHGRSAPPEITQAIEQLVPATDPGSIASVEGAIPGFAFEKGYESYLRSRLDWKALRQLKGTVVFDYLHGSGAGIPERLLKGLRLRSQALHAAHDAFFGGLHPEPIEEYLRDLKTAVRRERALVGIAVDGDADRLGIVDDKGNYLTPHQVFPLLVWHCVEHKKWKGKIVQSISLGVLAERIAKANGLPFEEVPVGFKHVAERMLHEDVLAGGEESGGYAVRGGLPERDGILSGLMFLEMLGARGKKPSELLRELEAKFGRARFKRVDMPLATAITDKAAFVEKLKNGLPSRLIGQAIAEVRTYDGMKILLEGGAWVLLRPSGTEPLIRTYSESDSWEKTDKLLSWAQKAVRSAQS